MKRGKLLPGDDRAIQNPSDLGPSRLPISLIPFTKFIPLSCSHIPTCVCYLFVLANIRISRTTIMVKHPLSPVIIAVSLGICPLEPVDHVNPFLGNLFPGEQSAMYRYTSTVRRPLFPPISLDCITNFYLQA
jgi:hypothetical protein